MQPFCKTIDAKDDTRDITFARLRDQISTTVTQTPSSYERKGEGLNFARQMIGIFKWWIKLKFWTSDVSFFEEREGSVFCFWQCSKCRIGQTSRMIVIQWQSFQFFFGINKKGVVITKRTPWKSIISTRRLRESTPLEREHSLLSVFLHCQPFNFHKWLT